MGFRIVGRWRPLSKFMDLLQHLMWMASVVSFPTNPTTLTFPKSILCSCFATCTGIPLFTSLFTTARLCSVRWTCSLLWY